MGSDFASLTAPIKEEINEVKQLMLSRFPSGFEFIDTRASSLLTHMGKMLRPAVLLLAAQVHGYKGRDHLTLATAIEFIHTATLLHDDVVDEASLRRGRKSANARWGNKEAVLVGDFLYSRAFELLVEAGNQEVIEALSSTTNLIAQGELLQLAPLDLADEPTKKYLAVVKAKTATLFAACGRLAGLISAVDPEQISAMEAYGHHLGMAFQMADDVLDYGGDTSKTGKSLGEDFVNGKYTLPLLIALNRCKSSERRRLAALASSRRSEDLPEVLEIFRETRALEGARQQAAEAATVARKQLAGFAPTPSKKALEALTFYAVERIS